jgi:hypothetical protein
MHLSLTRRGRALLAGLAAVSALGGAAAGSASASVNPNDPALDVAANTIEHVVREVTITGALPRHTLDELWLGSDKAHWISRDAATGRVVRETTFDRGVSLTYDAETNSIDRLDDKDPTPPWQTDAQEAAIWKDAFATGKTRQTGETTVFGRRALVLESVRGQWVTDEPAQVTTMVVDADTYALYDIKTVLDAQHFSQDVAMRSFETVDRTAQTESVFAMLPHPGARDARAARAAAKRRAAHHKTKHVRKAHRHTRRHH